MNIIELQDNLKDLPDRRLIQEMQTPTGNMPQFLVLSELTRRKRMRDDYNRQDAANMPTVAEEVMTAAGVPQGGITAIARNMAPNSSIAQNTSADMAVQREPTRMPQKMADGGVMRLNQGYKISSGTPISDTFLPARIEMTLSSGNANDRMVVAEQVLTGVYGPEMQSQFTSNMLAGNYGDELKNITEQFVNQSLANSLTNQEETSQTSVSTDIEDYTPDAYFPRSYRDFLPTNIAPVAAMSEVPVRSADAVDFNASVPNYLRSIQGMKQFDETAPVSNRQIIDSGVPLRSADTNRAQQLADSLAMRRSDLPGVNLPGESNPYVIDSNAAEIAGQALLGSAENPVSTIGGRSGLEFLDENFNELERFNTSNVNTSPMSYNNLLSKAQGGVPITENDIVQSVEAGLLNDQQAADINSIIDDPSYMPSQIEQDIANNPADLSFPDVPTNPDLLFPKIAGGISDYVGGVFGGRTIGDQAEIDAARKKQAEDYRKYEDSGGFSSSINSIESPVGSMTEEIIAPEADKRRDNDPDLSELLTPKLGQTTGTELSLEGGVESLLPPSLTGGDAGGGAGSTVGDSYSTLEGRIAKMLDDREKSAESDKYLALAQAGLALMASDSPTLGGAIGEAGLVGISQMREARNQYDKDILGLLGTQADIDAARSDASLAERKFKMQERELEASLLGASDKQIDKMIDDTRAYLNTLQSEARSYRRVEGGDGALTEDRIIDMIPDGVKADIVTTTERLKTLERLRSGKSTEFDATKQ